MTLKFNAIVLKDVGFEHAQGLRLFKNISYSFQPEVTALVGENGVGKTTLAKLIMGLLAPSEGAVIRSGEVRWLQQEEARPPQSIAEYLQDIWDSPVGDPGEWMPFIQGLETGKSLQTLSGGEWMRVRLAKVLSIRPALLILDEPTNNLDLEARRQVLQFVESSSVPLLLITHDRALLSKAQRILELSSQGLKVYGGDFKAFQEAKEHEEQLLENRIESAKLKKEAADIKGHAKIAQQEKRIRKGTQHGLEGGIPRIVRGALKRKAQVTLGNVKSDALEMRQDALDNLIELQKQKKQSVDFALDFANLVLAKGKLVFAITELNFSYSESPSRFLLKDDLDWTVQGPERWAICGKNGVGKSTLAKTLCGLPNSATVKGLHHPGQVTCAYLDQDYSLLNLDKSLLENVQDVSNLGSVEIRNRLARFQFVSEKALRPVKFLSGGEKLKAALALIVLNKNPVQLLVLDEPTNNLDLEGLSILTKALQSFKGALVVISHDQQFLDDLRLDGRIQLQGPGIAF